MKSILDSSFRYTPSAETDLRKTFARARRKLREETEDCAVRVAATNHKVTPLKLKGAAILTVVPLSSRGKPQ